MKIKGDAPVHTYFVLLTLKLNEIHRFRNIAYTHYMYSNWPVNANKEICDRYPSEKELISSRSHSCVKIWDTLN